LGFVSGGFAALSLDENHPLIDRSVLAQKDPQSSGSGQLRASELPMSAFLQCELPLATCNQQ
jgi:hypothetical protein